MIKHPMGLAIALFAALASIAAALQETERKPPWGALLLAAAAACFLNSAF